MREYIGTTILPPSEFYLYLPNYLEYHELAITNNNINDSIRIMIISERDLYQDFKYFYDEFVRFINWHKKHKQSVKLYQIDPNIVEKVLDTCTQKPRSMIIGLWNDQYLLDLQNIPVQKRTNYNNESNYFS